MTHSEPADEKKAVPASSGAPASHPQADPPTPRFFTHPDRTDKLILLYLTAVTILMFVLMPLRVWLLNNPVPYALLVGGYTSAIVGGAQAAAGGVAAWVVVICALVGALKGVPLWWLIGRKWGVEYLNLMVGNSKRMRRWANRLDNLRPRTLLAVVFISYIPFMPTLVIANLLAGIRGVRFPIFLAVNAAGVLVRNSVFAYLGTQYGEAVIAVVDQVNRYALWITLALVVVTLWSSMKSHRVPRG